MLVLSRKLGEKIIIGQNICITVVDIDRGKIRLGIEAPRDVPIFRQDQATAVTYNGFIINHQNPRGITQLPVFRAHNLTSQFSRGRVTLKQVPFPGLFSYESRPS